MARFSKVLFALAVIPMFAIAVWLGDDFFVSIGDTWISTLIWVGFILLYAAVVAMILAAIIASMVWAAEGFRRNIDQ